MAAGLGFKTFTTGEVLTAADTNGYLMQGILVFASAAARDAAITSPQEGQFAYLKDTNVTTYYTGSAWANVDTTGMTNPMTTTGDIVYASSGSTPGRIGIGSTGNVLTVSGGVPVWSAPAGGGKVLQVVNATNATSTVITSSSYTDTNLTATITPTLNTSKILVITTQQIEVGYATTAAGAYIAKYRLMRDATALNTHNYAAGGQWDVNSTSWVFYSLIGLSYLDAPATTSATTYKTQATNLYGNTSVLFNQSSTSSITLLEIGA